MSLFYLGCIPTRLVFAYLGYMVNHNQTSKEIRNLFLSTTLAIGIGFLMIYMMGWRKTGLEVGGGKIWWNSLRPIHSLNYLLFTLGSLMGWENAWWILLLDVVIGIVAKMNRS
jgi:hypothetical protein